MVKELRGYMVLLWAETISGLGSNLTTFALAYWAWRQFGSPGAIAGVTIAFSLPMIIAAPIAGLFVDRLNRKAILIVTNTLLVSLMVVLAYLMSTGHLQIWHIVVSALLHALCSSFRTPTLMASMAMMVERDRLHRVNGLVQALNAVGLISGPLLGGILIGFMNLAGLLIIDACTFLVAVFGAIVVAIPDPSHDTDLSDKKRDLFQEIWAGAQFLSQRPSLLALVASSTVFNIFGSFLVVLLLPMSSSIWQHQPEAATIASVFRHFGGTSNALDAQISSIMNTLLFIGIFVGGLIMANWTGLRKRVWNILVGVIIAGVSQSLVSTHSVWVAGGALCMCGLIGPLCNTTSQTIYLSKTPPGLQGRVLSLIELLGRITYPLGLMLVSLLSHYYSPGMMLLGSGMAGLISMLLFFFCSPMRYVDARVADYVDYRDVINAKEAIERK